MAFNIESLLEKKVNPIEEAENLEVDEEEEKDGEEEEDEDKNAIDGWNNLASSQLAMYAIANDLRSPTLVELQMLLGVSGEQANCRIEIKMKGKNKIGFEIKC
uniref:Uncharacterized protein n=1 Tax=Caenorhabditis tropicalis TaxID=1561998 RepID=A0A1I7TXI9_9PELO